MKIYPHEISALGNEGLVLAGLGKDEEAIACYDEIINKLDPRYIDAWLNKGNALGRLGKDEEAITCYDEIINKLDPRYMRMGHNLMMQFSRSFVLVD